MKQAKDLISNYCSCAGKTVEMHWKVDGTKDRQITADDVVLFSATPSDVTGKFLGVIANLYF